MSYTGREFVGLSRLVRLGALGREVLTEYTYFINWNSTSDVECQIA